MPLEPFDSGPLLYFLQHSIAFVVGVGTIFFLLGLLFGKAVWGRFKSDTKSLTHESELLKQEIAKLKRNLAEHSLHRPPAPARTPKPTTTPPLPAIGAPSATLPSAPPKIADPTPPASPLPHENPSITARGIVRKTVTVRSSTPSTSPEQTVEPLMNAPPTPGLAIHLSQLVKTAPPLPTLPSFPVEGLTPLGHSTPNLDPDLGPVYPLHPDTQDDLNQIIGIGPVIAGRLHACGIYTFRQIAEWSPTNVRAISKRLAFKDRIQREDWIGQAKSLLQQLESPSSPRSEAGPPR